jgi:hypothetical protein
MSRKKELPRARWKVIRMAESKYNSIWGQKRVLNNLLSNSKDRVIQLKPLSDR